MYEAILSLAGVLIEGAITFLTAFYVDQRNDAREQERNKKTTLAAIVSNYEELLLEIRNEISFIEPGRLCKYYYDAFSKTKC